MVATTPPLESLSQAALTERLYELRRQERRLLVELLLHIAEVARRKSYLAAGYTSMFAFLQRFLGYSNAAAYRRMTAASLLTKFPAVASYLTDGRLSLTTLVELRDVLDADTHLETLDRAAGKCEEDIKILVASMRPKPAMPDLLRRLPQPRVEESPAGPPAAAAPPPPTPRPVARLEPISEELRILRVTVGREFVADLEAVRAGLSHVLPDGSLEKLLHECLRRTRRELERRREGAAERPRDATSRTPPVGRGVARAVLRQLHARDGGRGSYVAPDGTVCGSTHRVEVHHIHPYAQGGEATLTNLALVCAAHNGYFAERDFGAAHIERAVQRARAERANPRQLTLV